MKKRKRPTYLKRIKRVLIFSLSTLLLALSFVTSVSGDEIFGAENTGETGTKEERFLPDGAYNLINTYNNKALDVYNLRYDSKGRTYMAKVSEEEDGQDFRIIRQENGTYHLYPQSEEGLYMLCYEQNASVGSILFKTKSAGDNTQFIIKEQKNGTYTISPANTENRNLVLCISNEKSQYGYNYAELRAPEGKVDEFWTFSAMDPKNLTLGKYYDRVKLYTVNRIYALVTPSFLEAEVTYTTSDKNVILVSENGEFCAISEGSATITVSCGNITKTCEIEVTNKEAFSWFSQHNMHSGGWNGTALSKLYFYSGGVYKRFIIDKYNRRLDWMDEGCALTSVAMVLRNMGAHLTEGYDFRTGQSGNLEADPYTAALANSYNTGSLTGEGTLYYNPIFTNSTLIASRFNVDGKALKVTSEYYVTKKLLKEKLDENPEGVIVCMVNSYNGTHYVVVTECVNPDETDPNKYEFIISDPAAYKPSEGDHVAFEQSISYNSMYYRYYHMTSLMYFDIVEE